MKIIINTNAYNLYRINYYLSGDVFHKDGKIINKKITKFAQMLGIIKIL